MDTLMAMEKQVKRLTDSVLRPLAKTDKSDLSEDLKERIDTL
jgi:hypothetical protein